MYEIIDGELQGEARRAAIKHIEGCERCMARMRVLVGLESAVDAVFESLPEEECPDPHVLQAYSEGALPPEEKRKVEEHLKVCDVCAIVLEEGAQMEKEYVRLEKEWLKSSKERLEKAGLYETVKKFLVGCVSDVEAVLAQMDAFRFALKPVPVFRGKKPAETPVQRIPVRCKSGVLVIAVTGKDPRTTHLRVIDEKGEVVADSLCSSEGIAAFFGISPGYYSVEAVDG